MKHTNKSRIRIFVFLSAMFCLPHFLSAQDGNVAGCPAAYGPAKIITGTDKNGSGSKIISNTTWYRDTIYILKGYVRVAEPATLKIQPGTIVMSMPAPTDTAFLIIEKGAKIIANGTEANPIVFTSCKAPGTRNRGDWGGIIILGKAKNNLGTDIELPGTFKAFHGGVNDDDNSGTLTYVRIEFPGLALGINMAYGLTFGSVGRKTKIHYIQVSNSNTDSYSWYGGNVNTRHLISWKCLDDDFDLDNGYSGYNQFGLAFRDPEVADISGSSGIEADNNAPAADPSHTIKPKTSAVFSNFEFWGPVRGVNEYNLFYRNGVNIRRGSELKVYNSLFIGWPENSSSKQSAIFIDGAICTDLAVKDSIRFRNCISAAYIPGDGVYGNQPASSWGSFGSAANWYKYPAYRDSVKTGILLDQKRAPFSIVPQFTVLSNKVPIYNGSSFATNTLPALPIGQAAQAPFGFQSVTYRGAFGWNDWAANWTEFNPNQFNYSAGASTRQSASGTYAANDLSADMDILTCYPNPASQHASLHFNLQQEGEAVIKVTDMTGSEKMVVRQHVVTGPNTIGLNTSSLPKGLYTIIVSTADVIKTTKLEVLK